MGNINSGTIVLGFVAILFGLGGTYALRVAMRPAPAVEASPEPVAKKPQRIVVPLASRNLAPGTVVSKDDIALFRMTREEITSTIDKKIFMTNPDQIMGKILKVALKRNAAFDTRDFYPEGQSPGIVDRLPSGKRAMTVEMTAPNALIGFAGPGQNVDVLFHYGEAGEGGAGANGATSATAGNGFYPQHHDFNRPRNRDYFGNTVSGGGGRSLSESFQSATTTLVQDVEILALNKLSTPTDAATGLPADLRVAVTLAVEPGEAELLRVARGHGELSLTLRGPDDEERLELLGPVTLDQIINVKSQVHELEIFRGQSVTRTQFRNGQTIEQKAFGVPTVAKAEEAPVNAPVFPYFSPIDYSRYFPGGLPAVVVPPATTEKAPSTPGAQGSTNRQPPHVYISQPNASQQ